MHVDFLVEIPLFITHTREEAIRVLSLCKQKVLKRGERLVTQGERTSSMFFLEAGELEVFQEAYKVGKVPLAKLTAGAVVGELAIIDPAPRAATVQAITPCVVQELTREDFHKLRDALDPAVYKLLRQISVTVCERLRETNEAISEIVEHPERIFANTPPKPEEDAKAHAENVDAKVKGFWTSMRDVLTAKH